MSTRSEPSVTQKPTGCCPVIDTGYAISAGKVPDLRRNSQAGKHNKWAKNHMHGILVP